MADPVRGEWLCEPLPRDVRAALARLERQPDVRRVAVMPDVHLARDVCIGTVVATGDTIYPQAVGGDIGCGMVTVRLRGPAARAPTEREGERLFDALHRHLPPVRRAQPSSLPDELQQPAARVVIFRVDLKVLRQIADPLAQQRHLHFGRASVRLVHLIRADELGLLVPMQHHC